jgi:hypothetical protein
MKQQWQKVVFVASSSLFFFICFFNFGGNRELQCHTDSTDNLAVLREALALCVCVCVYVV